MADPPDVPPDLTVIDSHNDGRRYRVRLDRLRAEVERRHTAETPQSYAEMAQMCGLERTTVYRLLHGPVSLQTACKMAKGLGFDQSEIVFEVPEDYSTSSRLMATEEVLEQVEQGDPPGTRFWMTGELTPYNRRLGPALFVIGLLAVVVASLWEWLWGRPEGDLWLYASLVLFLVSFFTVRIRWTLGVAAAWILTRGVLVGFDRMTDTMAGIEVLYVLVGCTMIRIFGMYSRHAVTQEAKVAVWADRRRIGALSDEARAWEWSHFRSGSS